jgi:hypothetical protein
MRTGLEDSCVGLTTCASAAGLQVRARTNLRFLWRLHRRVPPARNSAPIRPVGCMRGLDVIDEEVVH